MREENSLFEEKLQQEEILQEGASPEELTQEIPEEAAGEPCNQEPTHEETPVEEAAEVTEETAVTEEAAETPAAEENTESSSEARSKFYHERYYLRYREGKRTFDQDLAGTRNFLHTLGFDGGELRQAREGKDWAEAFRQATQNKNNQMYCSYCGSEISGVEFFRLPDGRLRCTTCSNTVVQSKAEVEALCKRVIENLDNFFGATIDVPISIEVVDERKLKKKIGVPLGTKDSQSMLILGVAINKRKKYKIILENGAPRISLIATFAHELTHIWQYTHWDNKKNFKKCPRSKRLLIYEGMAKWAEIQYLYLIGETATARREEARTRERQDEYGIGFCLYEDRYPLCREVMTCEDTPFTPNEYPL